MKQHTGAGAKRRRERAQRKVGHAVAEEVSERVVEELVARLDVTTVTYRIRKSTPGWSQALLDFLLERP